MQALIDISLPGTIHSVVDSPFIQYLQKRLEQEGCKVCFVDTVAGSGCLDQDWIEFKTEIDSNWGWVQFPNFSEEFQEEFFNALHHGTIIMMVHVKNDKEEWVPYR